MKKFTFIFLTCILLLLATKNAFAAESPNIILLKGTNEMKDGFPVYEEGGDNKAFMDIRSKSFIKKSIELYGLAQQYSDLKQGDLYLALKENSGCYGRVGFYLKKDGNLYDKRKSLCIELSSDQLEGQYGTLQSITQIFPHEMGHILYISTTCSGENPNQTAVDTHYSNTITEYSTAFNEGFAEHFEVISRINEENVEIKNGIQDDIKRKKRNINPILNRANRDFLLPLRLDYYREISPFWQQQYENLKRHELALNGDGKYKNLSYNFRDREKTILYRNMGLFQNKLKNRNLEQSLSTEIVISHFFVNLINTDKGNLEDKYSKVFNVFRKYVNKDYRPQLLQFVKGYVKEYPQDQERVFGIFKESTGYDFTEECAPEIWIASEGIHINLIMDQFAGLEFPFYIFNINTCEKEDLLKLKGISNVDAETIIAYRDKNKGFKERKEFKNIEGISRNTLETLEVNSSKEKLEKISKEIEERQFQKNFSKIFSANLKHLGLRTILSFAAFFILYFIWMRKVEVNYKKNLFKNVTLKFLKFTFYVVLGLSSVVVGMRTKPINPILMFTLLVFICEGITFLIIRKNSIKVRDSLLSTLIMMILILYSLY